MKKISEYLRHNPRYKAYKKPLEAAQICDLARNQANGRFGVISFRLGLLTLEVDSSSQATMLQFETQKIIDKINQKLGRPAVKSLRFKITGGQSK